MKEHQEHGSRDDKKTSVIKNLKIFLSILLSIILVVSLFPSVFSTTTAGGIDRPIGDYGVMQSLDLILADKEQKSSSPQIENETKNRLDQIEAVEKPPLKDVPTYNLKTIQPLEYADFEPVIFEALKDNPIVNNTSILDFLFDLPLNYWIFTRSGNSSTWTSAMLRRTLTDLDKWKEIDVDNDPGNGNEVQVRFDIELLLDTFTIENILPLTATVKGGFQLTVERLVDRSFPLEIYVAKSISYEGENYIWIMGVTFDETPWSYTSFLLAESIKFSNFREKITNLIGPNLLRNIANATLAEINGPYSLRYGFDTDIQRFDIMAGLVKYENRTLTDKNWLMFFLTPATDQVFISRSGEVWVDSSNIQAPIDNLRWTSGIFESSSRYKIPINLRIMYGELREHLIMADVKLIDLPEWFSLQIDYTKVVEGKNVTVLDYAAADVLSALNYTSYLFPDFADAPGSVNCTHVLLEDVPKNYHMEMTSDIGRDINTTPYHDPKVGIIANIIDNLVVRLSSRFYRIGKYLKLAAEGLLELPSDKGWAILDAHDDYFSNIEFYQSFNQYLDAPGDYFAFFNDSDAQRGNVGRGSESSRDSNGNGTNITTPKPDTSKFTISGRLSGLNWLNISFGMPLEFELRTKDEKPLIGLFVDNENYAYATISNVPQYIRIINQDQNSYYSTIDPELDDDDNDAAEGAYIERFEFISKVDNQFMKLQINQVPPQMEFSRQDDLIKFSTLENSYIEDINFVITSDVTKPYHQIATGDYMFIYQSEELITGSGKLSGIKNLTFDQGDDGYIELNLNQEIPLQVMLVNTKDENTKAKVLLDPLPSHLNLKLPGIIKKTNIEFPNMDNTSGFIDYSELVFTLGAFGNELIDLMGNLSQNLIDSIGNIGFNFSISYDLESFGSNLDVIAEIERGGLDANIKNDIYATATDEVLGGSIGWTHGIIMREDNYEGNDILRGHLYLQGMPSKANLSTYFTANTTKVNIDFKGYNPRHDWLLIELMGIQDRDISIFFQKVPDDVDFYAAANLTTNLQIGGEMKGKIDIRIFDSGCDFCTRELGALYLNMHTYEPIQSIREFLISGMPSSLKIDFKIQKQIKFTYDASDGVEFIYTKLSKILTVSWHHVNLILHDLPKWFKFNLFSNKDFDMDQPLPLQGMPRLDITTNGTSTLDLLVSLDGAAFGQRGNYELLLQNIQDTSGILDGSTYNIDSKGLDFMRIKITKLPILDNYKINSLILESENFRALVFKVNLLFGVFPYFDLGSNSQGKIEITMDHTLKIFGQPMDAKVALIDIVYENAGGARIPVASPMFINSINSDLKRSQDHVVIPAVLVSLIITWLSDNR